MSFQGRLTKRAGCGTIQGLRRLLVILSSTLGLALQNSAATASEGCMRDLPEILDIKQCSWVYTNEFGDIVEVKVCLL